MLVDLKFEKMHESDSLYLGDNSCGLRGTFLNQSNQEISLQYNGQVLNSKVFKKRVGKYLITDYSADFFTNDFEYKMKPNDSLSVYLTAWECFTFSDTIGYSTVFITGNHMLDKSIVLVKSKEDDQYSVTDLDFKGIIEANMW